MDQDELYTSAISRKSTQSEDPDAQATLTEFLDYTEYLPSDIARALLLIRKLDTTCIRSVDQVHTISSQYGAIDTENRNQVVDPTALRNALSRSLSKAVQSRQASYVEALRLQEVVARHSSRLSSISAKLRALPLVSTLEDISPERPTPSTKRSKAGKITLRLNAQFQNELTQNQQDARGGRSGVAIVSSPNPAVADWMVANKSSARATHTIPDTPPPRKRRALQESEVDTLLRSQPLTPQVAAIPPSVRMSRSEISTRDALLLLEKPPDEVEIGGEHAPWLRLTEYEMAVLRKKMKKNASWLPSESMVRRELGDSGRGLERYQVMKAKADSAGTTFLDYDAPGHGKGRKGATVMKDNDQGVYSKRQAMLKASLHDTQEVISKVQELGMGFQDIFKKKSSQVRQGPSLTTGTASSRVMPNRGNVSMSQKRKHGQRVLDGTQSDNEARSAKRNRWRATSSDAQGSSVNRSARKTKTTPLILDETPDKTVHSEGTHRLSNSASRRSLRQALPNIETKSAQQIDGTNRRRVTLAGTVPATLNNIAVENAADNTTAASRRPRRSLASIEQIHNQQSTSTRKQTSVSQAKESRDKYAEDEEAEDEDADEPRYCICNDYSHGEMIGCDNDKCEKLWFHFECVNLTEHPARRSKWFCPGCSKKMKGG